MRRLLDAAWNYACGHRRDVAIALVIVGLGLAGVWVLGRSLTWLISLALLVLVGLTLRDNWKKEVFEFIGSVVVGIVTLIGFNLVADVVVHAAGLYDENSPTWTIFLGLVAGVAVFWFAAYSYLRRFGKSTRYCTLIALIGAVAFVFGLPLVFGLAADDAKSHPVPRAERVLSQLDVFIVAEQGQRSARPDMTQVPTLREFDVQYSVGFAEGRGVRWTLADGKSEAGALDAVADQDSANAGKPKPRKGADHVLLLVPDRTPPVAADPATLPDVRGGDVDRWGAVADAAGLGDAPTFALLQTTDLVRRKRLTRWADLGAVSAQELGSRTLTDVAVRLAVGAPTAIEDFSQAVQHRPVLLFDTDEPVPRPLSIEALFSKGKVKQCPLRGARNECKRVQTPANLENGDTRLDIDRPGSDQLQALARREDAKLKAAEAAAATAAHAPPPGAVAARATGAAPPATPPTADATPGSQSEDLLGEPLSRIYVHTVSRQVNNQRLLFLDYWWYLPSNPARSGAGAFCGAGLVAAGISCFNHESDWEGVTVVVDRTRHRGQQTTPTPKAVYYAQHDSVVRYEWGELRQRWDAQSPNFVKSVDGGLERPLVYVARGTHSSYPTPCFKEACKQVAHDSEEKSHDGKLPWAGNGVSKCGQGFDCLAPLPTLIGGSRAALWNAFAGPWGRTHCVLDFYCNSTLPPSAPGQQGRYKRPWACSGRVVLAEGERAFKPREKCLDD